MSNEFKMGRERRDIWNNTDPARCGLPYENIDGNSTPFDLIKELVSVAVMRIFWGRMCLFGNQQILVLIIFYIILQLFSPMSG